jgi:hypothetical protein
LSPKSEDCFQQTREAEIGKPLKVLLKPDCVEDQVWDSVKDKQEAVSNLLGLNQQRGPFVPGGVPSAPGFFIAGALQSARMVDERIQARVMSFDGVRLVVEACALWVQRDDRAA